MFPVGWAGLGLLILRLCVAEMLLRNTMLKSTVEIPFWAAAGLIVLAISLCIGALTPLSCIGSCLAQIATPFYEVDQDLFELAFSVCVTLALLLLGPGAFSGDLPSSRPLSDSSFNF